MSKQDTEDGIKWIEALVFLIADELGIQLDGLPEWDMTRLNPEMAVEVAGRRKILTFWRSDIDDSQGENSQPTREVRAKILAQILEFMETFAPPKRQIVF